MFFKELHTFDRNFIVALQFKLFKTYEFESTRSLWGSDVDCEQ